MRFEKAVEYILEKEGGFTNNPADNGNWAKGVLKGTKWGISARSYPSLDIKNLTREDAKAIYKRDFWDTVKADELPASIRLHAFDVSVNSGPGVAIKMLQSILGVKQDGVLGPVTLSRAHSVTPWQFALARNRRYCNIVKNDKAQLVFIEGWLNRNLSITEICVNYN